MASTSPGYGITIRVEGAPELQPVALITAAITGAGATITALDVVESLLEKVVIDVTCDTIVILSHYLASANFLIPITPQRRHWTRATSIPKGTSFFKTE